MIVVDTNVVASIIFPTEQMPTMRRVWQQDSVWFTPKVWLYEFRNVIATRCRRGLTSEQQGYTAMVDAREVIKIAGFDASDNELLRIALQSGCTAYDCEFVVLAHRLDTRLVTMDKQILRAFPNVAMSPDNFLMEHSRNPRLP